VDDTLADGHVPFSVQIGAAASNDPAFNGLDAADPALWNLDNDRMLVLGDLNLDGVRTNTDIQAMLDALVNLDGYKASHYLLDADLISVADVDGNGAVGNTDIQALLDLLTSAGGLTAGSTGGTTTPTGDAVAPDPLVLELPAEPVVKGSKLTLRAQSVDDASLKKVEFFLDSNANGRLDPAIDRKLGGDTSARGGWMLTVSTSSWAAGSPTVFAKTYGRAGLPVATAKGSFRLNAPPRIASFAASSVTLWLGHALRLKAADVLDRDGWVQRVEFFHDANGNGLLDPATDTLLGEDTSAVDGWFLDGINTGGFSAGASGFFARAIDDLGAAGPAKKLLLTLAAPLAPTIGPLSSDLNPLERWLGISGGSLSDV
jgi:hypothetical protein